MEKKAYQKLLSDDEYLASVRLGALTKLAQLGLTMSDFEGMVKQAQGAPGALGAFGAASDIITKWIGRGTDAAQNLAKLVLLAGGISAVPLGVGAHLIGRRMSEQDVKEKEMTEQLKYYQNAAKGFESGLAAK